MSAAQVQWLGNAAAVSQVVTITVSAVATNAVLTVTINNKSVSYTCLSSDTTSTAAANLQGLLTASQFPEFQEATWGVSTNAITATSNVAGTPIYSSRGWGISVSATGGGTLTLFETQPNVSPSDIANPVNWLRNGVNAVPQNGDQVTISNSSVPLLWNLDTFCVPGSFTRWQDFTGTIGLSEVNPLGYVEYRPTYLSCVIAQGGNSGGGGQPSGPCCPPTTTLTAVFTGALAALGTVSLPPTLGGTWSWTATFGSPQACGVSVVGVNCVLSGGTYFWSINVDSLPGPSPIAPAITFAANGCTTVLGSGNATIQSGACSGQNFGVTLYGGPVSPSSASSTSSGSPAIFTAILGQGTVGTGPTRERYNFGNSQVTWIMLGSGSPQDNYQVRVLSTNSLTSFQVTNTTLGVGMLAGETATFGWATVDGGGTLDLGQGVTVTGFGTTNASVMLFGATCDLFCTAPSVYAQQGSTVTVGATSGTSTPLVFPTFTVITGSTLTWNSDATITTIVIQNGCTMDCSQDVRKFTMGTLTIDADTCVVNDPNNRTMITNAVPLNQRVVAGPFIFGAGRAIKIVV